MALLPRQILHLEGVRPVLGFCVEKVVRRGRAWCRHARAPCRPSWSCWSCSRLGTEIATDPPEERGLRGLLQVCAGVFQVVCAGVFEVHRLFASLLIARPVEARVPSRRWGHRARLLAPMFERR